MSASRSWSIHMPDNRQLAGFVSSALFERAYEVYGHTHHQPLLPADLEHAGGFSHRELIAYLFAGNFPREEWHSRVIEGLNGVYTNAR